MRRVIIPFVAAIAVALAAPAADASSKSKPHHARTSSARADGAVTYNRDSPDPNIGWHWENGMRTCSHDCDNPEILGSGYTCKNVAFMGMAMRKCDAN
jgi:hypothetical protein